MIIKKSFLGISFVLMFQVTLSAAVLDYLGYVPNEVSSIAYADINKIINFSEKKGIPKDDLPYILGDRNLKKLEDILHQFGLEAYNIQEILYTPFDNNDETLILVSTNIKKIKQPKSFREIKKGTGIYLFDKNQKMAFAIDGSLIVLGDKKNIAQFLKNKRLGNKRLTTLKKSFIKESQGKALYLSVKASKVMEKKKKKILQQGKMVLNSVERNLYISTILKIQEFQMGLDTASGLNFSIGAQGQSPQDGHNLLMISHFSIVGASLALTFLEGYSEKLNRRSGTKQLGETKKDFETLQKIFARIKTETVRNGVRVSMDFNKREIGAFASIMKRNIEQEKQRRIARLERKSIDELIFAINKNDKKEIDILMRKKINFNGKGMWGTTIINAAAKKGNTKLVALLIKKGADVNLKGRGGVSPLQAAVETNQIGVARILIDKGASIHVRNSNGETLLHIAARNYDVDMVKFLAEKGVNVNSKNYRGKRAIDLAHDRGFKKIVKFFQTKYRQSLK